MRKEEAELFTPAEAAVLSRLSLKAVNNAIDKKNVPARRSGGARLLDETAVVYLALERRLAGDTTPEFRRRLFAEINAEPNRNEVIIGALRLDLREPRREIRARARELCRAERLVVSDREIFGGAPVFRGTRIPVHRIAFLLGQGDTLAALRQAHPRLTDEMLRIAPIYAKAHPLRGRPRKQPWHDHPPLKEWTTPLADAPRS
jgi:uncharacterized protein (DUF433 family)